MGKIIGNFLPDVLTFTDLPVNGNTLGDTRLVKDVGTQYYWSTSSTSGPREYWLPINETTTTGGASDENKQRSWFGV